ncbi:MAG: hypothetical protein CMP10_15730 [Zetaproteobacteria bacterium]|nr:hypothetical protein [Pseudobdellovibrionaceae bacterium]|tara:strand:+ start:170 stop:598 length:429 start_codon:yes stop_codon:yes gene_type:complete
MKLIFILLVSIIPLSGCKQLQSNTNSATQVEITAEQQALISQIIRQNYDPKKDAKEQGAKEQDSKLISLKISDQLLVDFGSHLFKTENQTSRTKFLGLISRNSSPELETYLVQEFAVMTNFFQVGLASKAGIEVPLLFIGGK